MLPEIFHFLIPLLKDGHCLCTVVVAVLEEQRGVLDGDDRPVAGGRLLVVLPDGTSLRPDEVLLA